MAQTVTNVTAGKPAVGGAVWRAPVGTSLPTDVSTSLNSAFKCLGYLSQDGLTNGVTRESEDIKAWGGDTVLKPQTSFDETWKGTFIEAFNTDVLKMVHGNTNVTGDLTNGIAVTKNSKELEEASYVADMIMRGGVLKRVVIPKGVVTEVGEVTYKDSEAVGYETTIGALPDASGNSSYEYIKTASQAAATPAAETGTETQTETTGGGG